MVGAAGQGDHSTEPFDLDGRRARRALLEVTPSPNSAIASRRKTDHARGRNGDHTAQSRHLHRHVAVGRSAIAQLAVDIAAPRPYAAIGLARESMIVAESHIDDFRQTQHLTRYIPVGVGAVA